MKAALLFLLAAAGLGGDMRDVAMGDPVGGAAPTVTIDAMPYTRTVTCTGSYTLTGTASGAGAVSWASSPSGDSGACTGTTSWSCAVAVSPDATGEGVETITVTQSGGGSDTEDIGFYVTGSHSCFLSQSVDGSYNSTLVTTDPVATWENLGSSALDVTQGTGTAQPTYLTGVVAGQPMVSCDGGDFLRAATASDWTFLSNGTDSTIDGSVNITTGTTTAPWISTREAVATGTNIEVIVATEVSRSIINNGGASPISFSTATGGLLGSIRLFQQTSVSGTVRMHVDGADDGGQTAASYAATAPAFPLTLCRGLSSRMMTGQFFRVLIYADDLTATQRAINQAVDEWALGADYPGIASISNEWLFIGDSLTEGKPAVDLWQDKLEVIVDNVALTFTTSATGGAVATQIRTLWRAADDPPPHHVFVLGGTNDMVAGSSAVDTFATLTDIYQEAQVYGTFVVAATIPPFGSYVSWTPTIQVQVDALNALILASPDVDVVVDLYTVMEDPVTPDTLRVSYRLDDVHPNNDGTTAMANAYATALGL